MIQTNELRVGNWVFYKNNYSCIQLVSSIGVQLMERNSEYPKRTILSDGTKLIDVGKLFKNVDELNPILLSDEILLNCGFEKYENVNYNRFRIYLENGDILRFSVSVCNEIVNAFDVLKGSRVIHIGKNVLYLHQLQNLYFYFMDKELDVRL